MLTCKQIEGIIANLHEVTLFFIDSNDVFSIIVNHIMEIMVPTVNRTKII